MQNDLKILTRIGQDLRIMIVESDKNLSHSAQEILFPFFDEIVVTHTAEETLALYKSNSYAIVYIDLILSDMEGIELITKLQNQDKYQKFIIFMDESHTHMILKLYELGIIFFIFKPFTTKYFLHVTYDVIRILLPDQYVEEQVSEFHKKLADITEENKLQCNLLMQQSKLIQTGEMLSMIAHQWRQPLSVITSIIATTRTKMALDIYKRTGDPYLAIEEDLGNSFGRIEEAADFLSKTVNDFRNFYRPTNTPNTFCVAELINSVCRMVIPEKHYINIDVELKIDTSIVITNFENELKQVLINIINNAKDAFVEKNIEKPKLRIMLQKKEDSVFLNITDNAEGIPLSIMEKIFLPYFSTKSEKNGTGIGLHMAKTIIERHLGGTINVRNDELYGGANFCIEIMHKINICEDHI
ncbi:MAG: hybrid sensor histidine kinase/response regulator [Sulfuricurvum sp.]|uniref:hybrid sensor histidine kinase/response regulator n=1 Tax=Sulfuricurvum sp. TaxID=2025608 RepID=UPI0025D2FF05|nr:hybrid sensor histidine kinase/response regulator [Sulfuricurvum sp.]MBV5321105.1 hybrid sensor histidine kinase/response regulator [Sulfuricurvum sp.]